MSCPWLAAVLLDSLLEHPCSTVAEQHWSSLWGPVARAKGAPGPLPTVCLCSTLLEGRTLDPYSTFY